MAFCILPPISMCPRTHIAGVDLLTIGLRSLLRRFSSKIAETEMIAKEVQCSAQTFDAFGIEGLGDQPRSGWPSRLTEGERSKLIALVRKAPPGRLERQAEDLVAREEEGSAQWSLNASVSGPQIRTD
jgi:hypothetical protein